MTFQEFLAKWNNQYADFDGYYGPQCVDLVQYWSQALGGPRFTGDAHNIYTQAGNFYTQVPNSPTAIPQQGNIIVWDGSYNGGPGHTGIATGKGDTSTFECFEQNDPTASNCHLKTYNYNKVLGWLHPKALPDSTSTTVDKATFDLLVTKSTAYDELKPKYDALVKLNSDNETSIQQKNATIDNLNQIIKDKDAKLTTVQNDVSERDKQLLSKDQTIQVLQEQATKFVDAQKQLNEAVSNLDAQRAENIKLRKENSAHMSQCKSYTTTPTQTLISEVIKRVLHL